MTNMYSVAVTQIGYLKVNIPEKKLTKMSG